MANNSIQPNYVGEGIGRHLRDGGSARREVIPQLLGSVGGKAVEEIPAFQAAARDNRGN